MKDANIFLSLRGRSWRCAVQTLVILFSCGIFRAIGGEAQTPSRPRAESPLHLAILSSPKTRIIADLLEVELAKNTEFHLLDREHINRVVTERGIYSLRDDLSSCQSTGKLLGADALVWLDQFAGLDSTNLFLRVSSVRQGVIIHVSQESWKGGVNQGLVASLAAKLLELKGKILLPRERLTGISVLNLRSPGQSPAAMEFEREVTRDLERGLSREPGVVVLERRKIPALEFEKLLAWDLAESKFWTSSAILDGNVSFPSGFDAPSVRLDLLVWLPGAEKPVGIQADIADRGSLEKEMQSISGTLAGKIKANPGKAPWSAKNEGAVFEKEAVSCLQANRFQEAAAAAEIACALGVENLETMYLRLKAYEVLSVWKGKASQIALESSQDQDLVDACFDHDYMLRLLQIMEVLLKNPNVRLETALFKMKRGLGNLTWFFGAATRSGFMRENPEIALSLRSAFQGVFNSLLDRLLRELDQKPENQIYARLYSFRSCFQYFRAAIPYALESAEAEVEYLKLMNFLDRFRGCPNYRGAAPFDLKYYLLDKWAGSYGAKSPLFWDHELNRPDAERSMVFIQRLLDHPEPRWRSEALNFLSELNLPYFESDRLSKICLQEYAASNQAATNKIQSTTGSVSNSVATVASPVPQSGGILEKYGMRLNLKDHSEVAEPVLFWTSPDFPSPTKNSGKLIRTVMEINRTLWVYVFHYAALDRVLYQVDMSGKTLNTVKLPPPPGSDAPGYAYASDYLDLDDTHVACLNREALYWSKFGAEMVWHVVELGFRARHVKTKAPWIYIASEGPATTVARVNMETKKLEILINASEKPGLDQSPWGDLTAAGPFVVQPDGVLTVCLTSKKGEVSRFYSFHEASKVFTPLGNPFHVLRDTASRYIPTPDGFLCYKESPVDSLGRYSPNRVSGKTFKSEVNATSEKDFCFREDSFPNGVGFGAALGVSSFLNGEYFIYHMPRAGIPSATFDRQRLFYSAPGHRDWIQLQLSTKGGCPFSRSSSAPSNIHATQSDLFFYGADKIWRVRRDDLKLPAPQSPEKEEISP